MAWRLPYQLGHVGWVSGARHLVLSEINPVLQRGPKCGKQGRVTSKELSCFKINQRPMGCRGVCRKLVRPASYSRKSLGKIKLNAHSLFDCFYNMFALKCFCSREAIPRNQEAACFAISVAVIPEGKDGTVWTDCGSNKATWIWFSSQHQLEKLPGCHQ